jgi:CNT family concentrative nucleoside transporter
MSERMISGFGLFFMLFLAWLFSNNKRKLDLRMIIGGIGLQFAFALFILKTTLGKTIFSYAQDGINHVVQLSDKGAAFIFGDHFTDHFFAFKVLPTIIFISSLSNLFFHWGIIQKVVQGLSWIMQKVMNVSSSEGLVCAANIFCGQTEAPLFVKPYIKTMTRSEINCMMTGGMASVAGGVLAAYVGFGISAGHLLAASFMSAPAAIMISKIIFPETEKSMTKGEVKINLDDEYVNSFDAACAGAADGLKLCLNVGAMIIAFIALIALINMVMLKVGGIFGLGVTLEDIFGFIFRPIAFMMGISWEESHLVGRLLGERLVINEFVAYIHLGEAVKAHALSERAITISTYALCGFANFSSIAIQIGGIGALEPSRKKDFAICGMKAMIGGTLSCLTTACIAGLLL